MQPPEVLYKKGVLKIFAKITGKHLPRSLFFNKVADMNFFLKKEIPTQVFSCEICKIFEKPFLQNISGRLLLKMVPDIEVLLLIQM